MNGNRLCSFSSFILHPSSFILLVVFLCCFLDTATAPAADAFEQTEPPQWTVESPVRAPASDPDQEAASRKLEQVRAEMDKAANAPPLAPVTPESPADRSMFLVGAKTFSSLLVVLALILVLVFLAKKYGKHTPLLAGSDLAKVLGKVYLAPRVSLHFVRTGGKVLVIGVTQNAIAVVGEFDAAAFETEPAETTPEGPAAEPDEASPDSFLDQLKASLQGAANTAAPLRDEDADIASLRQDIQRLQRYLEEGRQGRRMKEEG